MSSLTDNELFRINIFSIRLNKLKSFLINAPRHDKITISLEWNEKDGIVKSKQSGMLTELREAAIINEVRSFYLNESPNNFLAIRNIISSKYVPDSEKQTRLKDYKNGWGKILKRELGGFGINLDGRAITYQDVFDVYVNGVYAHNDTSHFEKFKNLQQMVIGVPVTRDALRQIFDYTLQIASGFNQEFLQPMLKEDAK